MRVSMRSSWWLARRLPTPRLERISSRCRTARHCIAALIAHEVAHAVVSQHLAEPLSVAAQEYLAAVVQFSVMDASTRDTVLAGFPGEGFESVTEINGSLYLFAPAWFLVSAYRHYLKQQDPAELVRGIIAGEIVMRDEFVD